ncbi:MAG: gmr [Pseudonocardiales bacterium]|nr:gmr [Pseudonocardiales bacterium]
MTTTSPHGRRSLRELLSLTPAELGLHRDEAVGVFLVDIDRFKAINDVLGYAAGDRMLRLTGQRLLDWGGPRAVLARVADDMFATIRPGLADLAGAVAEAERLRLLLAEPVAIDGQTITRNVSIGLSYGRLSENSTVELFRRADDAMQAAQRTSGNVVRSFSQDLRSQALTRSQIELHLRDALRAGQLLLHFQPEIDLRNGDVVAVEALVRWQHPSLGLLGADRFVGVAEETGVIRDLGEWVLREACRQHAAWRAEFPALRFTMRVNMSPVQLVEPDTPALVAEVLAQNGLGAGELCVEITELVAAPDRAAGIRVLHELHKLGIELAIDDFGMGHSSLVRLKALPVDTIKIDRSFVLDLGSDPTDTAIVQTLVRLAAAFGLEIIAEGVETVAAAIELRRLGCYRAQGHLLGVPVEAGELRPLLAAGRLPPGILPPDEV